MSTTEPTRTTVRTDQTGRMSRGGPDETKPFWMTSEFLVLAAAVAGVLIAASMIEDDFEARRAWFYVTILAAAYMISRGLAKAGSRHWGDHRDPR